LVKHFHRQLKAALPSRWSDVFHLVLLGIGSAVKEHLGCSSAEMVFGTTLRIPGLFFTATSPPLWPDTSSYVGDLRKAMNILKSTLSPSSPTTRPIPRTLSSCTHVFIRHDAIRRPLQHNCDGPFRILRGEENVFIVDRNGKEDAMSVDHIKPVFLDAKTPPSNTPEAQTTSIPSVNVEMVCFKPDFSNLAWFTALSFQFRVTRFGSQLPGSKISQHTTSRLHSTHDPPVKIPLGRKYSPIPFTKRAELWRAAAGSGHCLQAASVSEHDSIDFRECASRSYVRSLIDTKRSRAHIHTHTQEIITLLDLTGVTLINGHLLYHPLVFSRLGLWPALNYRAVWWC
uniref:Uncharacterized protein n=1 Tax=Mesocestoides corti TaxID=53468 RepID=A0A0R3U4F6_MESCO